MGRQLPSHKLRVQKFVPYTADTAAALQPAITDGSYKPWRTDKQGTVWFERVDNIEADEKHNREKALANFRRLVNFVADGGHVSAEAIAHVLDRAGKIAAEFEHEVAEVRELFEVWGTDA